MMLNSKRAFPILFFLVVLLPAICLATSKFEEALNLINRGSSSGDRNAGLPKNLTYDCKGRTYSFHSKYKFRGKIYHVYDIVPNQRVVNVKHACHLAHKLPKGRAAVYHYIGPKSSALQFMTNSMKFLNVVGKLKHHYAKVRMSEEYGGSEEDDGKAIKMAELFVMPNEEEDEVKVVDDKKDEGNASRDDDDMNIDEGEDKGKEENQGTVIDDEDKGKSQV